MKYVIFPVWAHLVRNKNDEDRAVNDDSVELEMGRQRAIMYERLQRSFSVSGELFEHCREADRLQKEFDEDSEPVRVYVFETAPKGRMVPVYAGRQNMRTAFAYVPVEYAHRNIRGSQHGGARR